MPTSLDSPVHRARAISVTAVSGRDNSRNSFLPFWGHNAGTEMSVAPACPGRRHEILIEHFPGMCSAILDHSQQRSGKATAYVPELLMPQTVPPLRTRQLCHPFHPARVLSARSVAYLPCAAIAAVFHPRPPLATHSGHSHGPTSAVSDAAIDTFGAPQIPARARSP